MKREKQKFHGTLTDKELNLIEDSLKMLGKENKDKERNCRALIFKLYEEFSEVPAGKKLFSYTFTFKA